MPIVKRHTVEGLRPKKEFGLARNANVQRKKCKKMRKIEEKSNEKKAKEKRVKVKIKKKNEEGGPE